MFDPTAFDNMKVVLEGAIYDLDLLGAIQVVSRKDLVNLAVFSRTFSMGISQVDEDQLVAEVILSTDIANLSAEILEKQGHYGCYLSILYTVEHVRSFNHVVNKLKEIWGETRTITAYERKDFQSQEVTGEVEVRFERLISEEQMDDLVDMVSVLEQSLQSIGSILR